ncbi:MAG: hypothetical protein NC453_30080, partial [Muribaculum sp.]|nr:hypothetical protein [Muribaculum sp.]
MDKKDFFELVLRRDLNRYVMLRKPRMTPQQVSSKLCGLIDINRIYRRMKDDIAPVCDRYMAIDMLVDADGHVPEHLPQWLNQSLAGKIADEYTRLVGQHYASENFMPTIMAQI